MLALSYRPTLVSVYLTGEQGPNDDRKRWRGSRPAETELVIDSRPNSQHKLTFARRADP